MTHLTQDQQLEIMPVRDGSGLTPADSASQLGEKKTVRLLRHCQHTAEARNKVLIFYNKEGREDGATEEATLLSSSLTKISSRVVTQEWRNVSELEDSIHTTIRDISPSCPLLFIRVMSHGRMGALCGTDGIMLPVNDLIDQISQAIPASLPLVFLVQACQGSSPGVSSRTDTDSATLPTDAKRVSAEGCMHIDLVRTNKVLLMATATGGYALWGAYIKALAAEIGKADGKKDMHEMHTKAVDIMRQSEGVYIDIKQVPKYTDTLNGERLVLPKVVKGEKHSAIKKKTTYIKRSANKLRKWK